MELNNLITVGIGVGFSVIVFFLKKVQRDVEQVSSKQREGELMITAMAETQKNNSKLLEDRRKDIQNLFEKLNER